MRDVSVLFVCLGNICRSPTAEGVLRTRLRQAGVGGVRVDSAGTGGWHAGEAPDARARAAAQRRGIDISGLRARQVELADFQRFDYILAMDADNLAALRAMAPPDSRARIERVLDLLADPSSPAAAVRDVPDPYYGGADGFEVVLDLLERAADALLVRLEEVRA